MALLSRENFVNICTQAIVLTRDKITISNQLSGYKKYHQEIKENDYFYKNVREPLENTNKNDYIYRHNLLEHVGLGNCHELADFLLVEIAKKIDSHGARARIRIVNSVKKDHVYLEIKIKLKSEKDYSLWEVDAWDPRIIDISTRPNNSIKNHEFLDYGYSTTIKNSVYTNEINYAQRYSFFNKIPKPLTGNSSGLATPEWDILDKHAHLYSDHTIEEAIEDGKLDPSGQLHYLQKPSDWQKLK